MPLQKLPTATTEEKPEDPPAEKAPLTIRCLLFFDGTLNSRKNIDERVKHEKGEVSQIYLKNRINQDKDARLKKGDAGIDLEDDSYENDYSNIHHLEANVAPVQKGYDERVKVYVEGAGTMKYEPRIMKDEKGNPLKDEFGNITEEIGDNKDEQWGFAFAAGESGIKPKVERGILEAIEAIVHGPKKDPRENEKIYIEKLTLDIFGFSRGAASARYCVHRLLNSMDEVDIDTGTVTRTESYIEHTLRTHHMLDVREVEIRFVGLFDTVVSYKATQVVKLGGSLENWLTKQTAIKHEKVKRVVHLASAEEHRNMFCLHNIDSAGGKGEEYFLPGVHSDIGGGYLDGSDDGLIVTQAYRYWAQKDRKDYLVAHGWFKDEELVEDVITLNEAGEPDYVQLSVTRDKTIARKVRSAYCKIPLKIMMEKAGESDITLEPKLARDAAKAINAAELSNFDSRINKYIKSVGKRGSKPEDWQMAEPELNTIRHKHLHFSARYNGKYNGLGHNPRRTFFKNRRERYVFNG